MLEAGTRHDAREEAVNAPDLAALGWRPSLQQTFDTLQASMGDDVVLQPARVVIEHRGQYQLAGPAGLIRAWPPQGISPDVSKLERPGVGDWVTVRGGASDGDLHHIVHLFERFSALTRNAAGEEVEPQLIAANLDSVFIMTSMNQDFNLRRLERYLLVARASRAQPVFVLNKSDLAEDVDAFTAAARSIDERVPIATTSALRAEGLDALSSWLGLGQTVGLIGSSGVGKSTLVNRLLKDDVQETREIRAHDARGRHTTTHRELFVMPGERGILIDTPGMRELQLWGEEDLRDAFPAIAQLLEEKSCQFRDCRHNGEPGCAVAAALESGRISLARWQSYQKLLAEHREQAERRARRAKRRRRHPSRGGGRKKKRR